MKESTSNSPPPSPLIDHQKMSEELIKISNRDYLLNHYCPAQKADHRDIFTKAHLYAKHLHKVQETGMWQYGVPIESRPGPKVIMEFFGEKKEMIMLASNDYLNLSTDTRVHQAIKKALTDYGVGAGSSRVGTGYSWLHRVLEEKLADSFGKEAAILFPTGYDAISCPALTLLTKNDRILIDGSSHASIVDSAQKSGAVVRFFAHNNMERLESNLKRASAKLENGGILVMIEGGYSMDGDIAKLPEIVRICKKYQARLMIDEAHSIGVHGNSGHGVCEHFDLVREVDIIGGTFSKSLGATGGFVAADRDLINYFNYISKRIIFSAALPPILVAGIHAALEVMESDTSLRERLWDNVRYLASGMKQIGANVLGVETASVPILIGNDGVMFSFTQDLIKNGIFTFPAVYPTVPKGRSVFRLALQTKHEKKDLDHVIYVFQRLLKKYNLTKTTTIH